MTQEYKIGKMLGTIEGDEEELVKKIERVLKKGEISIREKIELAFLLGKANEAMDSLIGEQLEEKELIDFIEILPAAA